MFVKMVQDGIIYIYKMNNNTGKGSPLNPTQNQNTQLQSKTDVLLLNSSKFKTNYLVGIKVCQL